MAESRLRPFDALVIGSVAWAFVFYLGVIWTARIGNPVGMIVPYFGASLLGPFVTVSLIRTRPQASKHILAFAPILLGSVLAAPFIYLGIAPTVAGGIPASLRTTLLVFELLFLPIGLALAMLSRWAARRGHITEQV